MKVVIEADTDDEPFLEVAIAARAEMPGDRQRGPLLARPRRQRPSRVAARVHRLREIANRHESPLEGIAGRPGRPSWLIR